MANGYFSYDSYRPIKPAGDYLLVNPASDHIGYAGEQWLFLDGQRELEEMGKAFRAQTGKALYITEAWRSLETQEYYFYDRYHKVGYNSGIFYKGSYWAKNEGAATAAIPGTSIHGNGLAIDVGSGIQSGFNTPEHQAFDAIAARFGWDNTGRNFGEPWHYEQIGSTITPSDSGAVPISNSGDALVATDAEIKAIAAAAAEATVTRLVNSNAWTVMANQSANAATRTAQILDPATGIGYQVWSYSLANGYSASGTVRSAAAQVKIPLTS